MIDPRIAIIHKRLSPVKRILVFSSAKGGVGKSVCAAVSALALAVAGFRTGLFDLDFQGASAHILLGAELCFPEEDAGIKPFRIKKNLHFMSFSAFSGEHAVPLRGSEVSSAMIELLAVTVWDKLDFLIVDMPPGIGDEVLDLLRFMERPEFIIISTPSRVAVRVVERLLEMLRSLSVPVIGVIENMVYDHSGALPLPPAGRGVEISTVKSLAERFQVRLLGSVPFSPDLDNAIGNPDALLNSVPGLIIQKIISELP